MKISDVEKKWQNAKNVKNNEVAKTMPMVKNRLLSKITWGKHKNELMVLTSLISNHRYKRQYETSEADSIVITSVR